MLTPKGLAVSKVVPIFHLLYRVIYGFVFVIAYKKGNFWTQVHVNMHIYVCYKSKVMYSQLLREEGGGGCTLHVMS